MRAKNTDAVTTEKQIEQLNTEANLVAVGRNVMSADELLDAAENVDDAYFDDQTSEYLELVEGSKINLLFTGFGTMQGDSGEIKVAQFTGKENKKYIHGSTVIVGSLQKVQTMPCLVRLTHNGMVKGKGGNKYADIRVQVLKAPTA